MNADDRTWEAEIVAKLWTAVYCGIPTMVGFDNDEPCDETLWITLKPASTGWCPVHRHVLDMTVSPPLDLSGLIVCGERQVMGRR